MHQVPLLLQSQCMPTQPNSPATLVSLPGTLTVSRGNLGGNRGRKERKGTKKQSQKKRKNRKGKLTTKRRNRNNNKNPPQVP